MREEYRLLLLALPGLRRFLVAQPDASDLEVARFFIEQAQREKRGELPTQCFQKLIRWLPERLPDSAKASEERLPQLMPVIMKHKTDIAGTALFHRVAVELLADTTGAQAKTVRHAVFDRIQPTSPQRMRELLRIYLPPSAKPKVSKKPGPKPRPDSEKEAFRIAARVNEQISDLERLFGAVEKSSAKVRANLAMLRTQLIEAAFTEAQVDAALNTTIADNPTIAARRLVSATENIGYDAVARYHRAFRKAGLKSSG